MSIQTEISRITAAKSKIRNKLVNFGLVESTANIDTCANAVDGITNNGAISATVVEGSTYTIPKGYHNGSGTVTGLTDTAGEAQKYKTQAKTITPTKSQQSVSPDSGYYALSSVTVNAIPEAYQDVSNVTATAADVLTGKSYVTADGTLTAGTMTNNGTVTKTLDTATKSYTIPKGYHSGSGKVSITTESQTVNPKEEVVYVTPSSGKVLESVTVYPIDSNYVGSEVPRYTGSIEATANANITAVTVNIPEGYYSGEGTKFNLEATDLNYGLELAQNEDGTGDIENYIGEPGVYIGIAVAPPSPVAITNKNWSIDYGEETLHLDIKKNFYANSTAHLGITNWVNHDTDTVRSVDGINTTSYSIPKGYYDGQSVTFDDSAIVELLASI